MIWKVRMPVKALPPRPRVGVSTRIVVALARRRASPDPRPSSGTPAGERATHALDQPEGFR